MAMSALSPAVFAACGDAPADTTDAGPVATVDANTGDAPDAGPVRDAAESDAGPRPGDPASGDPELVIEAALDPEDLDLTEEVRHGDRLYWECAPPTQTAGAGHIWASFRLRSSAVEGLSDADLASIEENLRAQLVEVVAGKVNILAENEGPFMRLSKASPDTLELAPVKMILNPDVVGETTKPSQIDEAPATYRVTVPLPGGRTFHREAQVDTLVPESERPRGC
jgi:hypothetical protein